MAQSHEFHGFEVADSRVCPWAKDNDSTVGDHRSLAILSTYSGCKPREVLRSYLRFATQNLSCMLHGFREPSHALVGKSGKFEMPMQTAAGLWEMHLESLAFIALERMPSGIQRKYHRPPNALCFERDCNFHQESFDGL
jgi:hypothetical protein